MISKSLIIIFVVVCALPTSGRMPCPADTGKLLIPLDSVQTGITFVNTVMDTGEYNLENFLYTLVGSGVAIGDINNDGLPDIFLVGNQVKSRLYLNLGNFRFKDITDSAGINTIGSGWLMGCTLADINGDGLLDIYICNS